MSSRLGPCECPGHGGGCGYWVLVWLREWGALLTVGLLGRVRRLSCRATVSRTPGLRINLELRAHWEAHFPLASQAEGTQAPLVCCPCPAACTGA